MLYLSSQKNPDASATLIWIKIVELELAQCSAQVGILLDMYKIRYKDWYDSVLISNLAISEKV